MPTHSYTVQVQTPGSGLFLQNTSVTDVQEQVIAQTCASASPTAYTVDVSFNLGSTLTIDSLVMSATGGTITVTPYSQTALGGSAGTPVVIAVGTTSVYAPSAGIGTASTCPLGSTVIGSLKIVSDTAGAVFKLDAITTALN